MANPVGFEGANSVMLAPSNMNSCGDLQCFKSDNQIISCWRLTEDEINKILETGVVWLSIMGEQMPPVLIGGNAMVLVENKPAKAEPYIKPATR